MGGNVYHKRRKGENNWEILAYRNEGAAVASREKIHKKPKAPAPTSSFGAPFRKDDRHARFGDTFGLKGTE